MKSICNGCGRDIEKDFAYCPWCGEKSINQSQKYFDMISERYSKMHREYRNQQFRAVEKQLNELEQELDVLVLSAELHR